MVNSVANLPTCGGCDRRESNQKHDHFSCVQKVGCMYIWDLCAQYNLIQVGVFPTVAFSRCISQVAPTDTFFLSVRKATFFSEIFR